MYKMTSAPIEYSDLWSFVSAFDALWVSSDPKLIHVDREDIRLHGFVDCMDVQAE